VSADEASRRARRAREALAAARQDARNRGESPGPARSVGRDFPERHGDLPAAQRGSGGGDPQPLSAAISQLLAERGWRQQAAVGSAFGRWEQIVGTELAAHARPDGFSGGELVVVADSTAWATQLRLLVGTLVRRLNAELGDGTVRRVRVVGPAGPPRRPGAWRAPGGRGPRDTYG
jgi:predicted nucleic acid-binding Zn ribbon protein